jgi:hypothetical protein
MFSIAFARIEAFFCHRIHFDYRHIIVAPERKFNFPGQLFSDDRILYLLFGKDSVCKVFFMHQDVSYCLLYICLLINILKKLLINIDRQKLLCKVRQ